MADSKDTPPPIEVPTPSNFDLFSWLETLFDGRSQYPEKLDICVVTGQHHQRLVQPFLWQLRFAPQIPEGSPERKVSSQETPGRKKPISKEDIVALSNEILSRCQRDCEAQNRATTYGLHAAHFMRDAMYYDRMLLPLKPHGTHATARGAGGGGADYDEDDPRSSSDKYADQARDHDRQQFQLNTELTVGLVDRQHREIDRLSNENAKLQAANLRLSEALEKALDRQHERNKDMRWHELKIESVGKMINMGVDLAPTIVNAIAGKRLLAGVDPEAVALKVFLPVERGGRLTMEQFEALFGSYDEKTNAVLRQGVFTPVQSEIICGVAIGQSPTSDLDKVMPGSQHEITQEQVMRLQSVVPMELLTPMIALFTARMERRAKG